MTGPHTSKSLSHREVTVGLSHCEVTVGSWEITAVNRKKAGVLLSGGWFRVVRGWGTAGTEKCNSKVKKIYILI